MAEPNQHNIDPNQIKRNQPTTKHLQETTPTHAQSTTNSHTYQSISARSGKRKRRRRRRKEEEEKKKRRREEKNYPYLFRRQSPNKSSRSELLMDSHNRNSRENREEKGDLKLEFWKKVRAKGEMIWRQR